VPTYSRRNRGQSALVGLGEAIKRARIACGLSQEELALRVEIDRSYLGGIERGESNPTVLNLVKISGALDMAASDLVGQAGL
jgi:transcriptional regulator with XRE-family HTH domain